MEVLAREKGGANDETLGRLISPVSKFIRRSRSSPFSFFSFFFKTVLVWRRPARRLQDD